MSTVPEQLARRRGEVPASPTVPSQPAAQPGNAPGQGAAAKQFAPAPEPNVAPQPPQVEPAAGSTRQTEAERRRRGDSAQALSGNGR
jgi:hypothetical protein